MAKTRVVTFEKLEPQSDGSILAVFFLPWEETEHPHAVVIPPDCFIDRAARYDYDPRDPDFHATVLRHVLHECHTEAGRYPDRDTKRSGQIRSLTEADAAVQWQIKTSHVHHVRRAVPVTTEHVEAHRRRLNRPTARQHVEARIAGHDADYAALNERRRAAHQAERTAQRTQRQETP